MRENNPGALRQRILKIEALTNPLQNFDTSDRRRLYLAWHARQSEPGEIFLPTLVAGYPHCRKALGRECLLFLLSGYARFFPEGNSIFNLALKDKSAAVHRRATALRAYLRKQKLPPEGSDFWFFFSNQKGRAPKGRFADKLLAEHLRWFKSRGLTPVYAFAHELRLASSKIQLRIAWDSFDSAAFLYVRPNETTEKAKQISTDNISLFRKQVEWHL